MSEPQASWDLGVQVFPAADQLGVKMRITSDTFITSLLYNHANGSSSRRQTPKNYTYIYYSIKDFYQLGKRKQGLWVIFVNLF